MEKISFVLHGKIRGKKLLINEIKRLLSAENELAYYETKKANHAESLTTKALTDGCDYLIAVGGDGTLNEVVNSYLKGGGSRVYGAVLGVLPWGTGNDFARSTGNEKSVEHLAALIKAKSVRMVDAGEIEYTHEDGETTKEYFDNIADFGIGAEVVSRVNAVYLRKVILGGKLLFFFTTLRTILTFKHKPMIVNFDGQKWEGKIISLVIANGQFFGSGMGIAPEAKIDSGKFQLVIFGNLSVLDYLKHYGRIRKSEHLDLQEVQYHMASQISVESLGNRAVLEADGEVGGSAPVTFTCLPGVLPILAPIVD